MQKWRKIRATNWVTMQRKAGKFRKLSENHKIARRKKQCGKILSVPITIGKSIKKRQLLEPARCPQTRERFSYNGFSISLIFEFPAFSCTNRGKLTQGSCSAGKNTSIIYFCVFLGGHRLQRWRIYNFFSWNTFFELNYSNTPQGERRESGGTKIFRIFHFGLTNTCAKFVPNLKGSGSAICSLDVKSLYIGIYLQNFNHIKFFFGGEYSFERKPFANPLAAFLKIVINFSILTKIPKEILLTHKKGVWQAKRAGGLA